MNMKRLLLAITLLFAGCAVAPEPLGLRAPAEPTMAAAVRDACRSDVALLGEGSGHGDGRTLAFKAALVPRLVDECGFNAVLFEGSNYDFLELQRRLRRGQPVTRAMVASSIGGIWNRYEEMQPLITWLHQRLVTGRLRLGGIDDQLGSAGAFYSISEMPTELTGLLNGARAGKCRETLRRRIYGEYQWLSERLGSDTRSIVWGATVHLSRDATATKLFLGGDNFGAYINRAHGRRAFFLGFAAAGGASLSGTEMRARPDATLRSVEAGALAKASSDSVYVSRRSLQGFGSRSGGLFSPEPVTTNWANVVDGLVVFREERPPVRVADN